MARRRKGRVVDGILILDKPSGSTSNASLQKVKWLFNAQKAGHTGSLDPLASGVLPICFGHATKISAFLLDADKAYEVTCRLGVATDTADSEGSVIAQSNVLPTLRQIIDKLPEFHGPSTQIPPMYSALKRDGKRLYELARQGKVVERPPRPIVIHALDFLALDGPDLTMKVNCSKGTYVRTLVEDFAKSLGTLAHVTALRRTAAGPFTLAGSVTIDQIDSAIQSDEPEAALGDLLQPIDTALPHIPRVEFDADMAFYLLNGQALQLTGAPREGLVRLYSDDLGLLGIGEVLRDGRVTPKRLFRSN